MTPANSPRRASNVPANSSPPPARNRPKAVFKVAARRASSSHAWRLISGITRRAGGLFSSAARRAHSVGVTPASCALRTTISRSPALSLTFKVSAVLPATDEPLARYLVFDWVERLGFTAGTP